jgi:hypothetical protein
MVIAKGNMRFAALSRQFVYAVIAAPVGFSAFYFVDWYWFDGVNFPAVVTWASNIFSNL